MMKENLILKFSIIPLELSTGNIYELSDDHCDKINKLSKEILERRMQSEATDK